MHQPGSASCPRKSRTTVGTILFRTITRRFASVFVCVFLAASSIAWFRHTVEYAGTLRFFSTDFLLFSLVVFTTTLPVILLLSALIVLSRMHTSRESEMLRTFAVPGSVAVRYLSHSFKILFFVLILLRETAVPAGRETILRILLPDAAARSRTVAMKLGDRDVFLRTAGDYRTIYECYVWEGPKWEKFVDLTYHDGRWQADDGPTVDLPSPSRLILSDLRSLEFLGVAELAELADRSGPRKSYLTMLLLERLAQPFFFYLLAILSCRMFTRKSGGKLSSAAFWLAVPILGGYAVISTVRYLGPESVWLQTLTAFGPSIILAVAAYFVVDRHPAEPNMT